MSRVADTVFPAAEKLDVDLFASLANRFLECILDDLEPRHGKAPHRIFEFLQADLVVTDGLDVTDEVAPETSYLALVDSKGLPDTVLSDIAVFVGVHFLESLLEVIVTKKLFLVGRGGDEFIVVNRPVCVQVNFFEKLHQFRFRRVLKNGGDCLFHLRHAQLAVLVLVDDHEEGSQVAQLIVLDGEVADIK